MLLDPGRDRDSDDAMSEGDEGHLDETAVLELVAAQMGRHVDVENVVGRKAHRIRGHRSIQEPDTGNIASRRVAGNGW